MIKKIEDVKKGMAVQTKLADPQVTGKVVEVDVEGELVTVDLDESPWEGVTTQGLPTHFDAFMDAWEPVPTKKGKK